MEMTTTTQISTQISGYYDRRLLDRLTPNLFYVGFGQEKPVPKGQGKTITFRRFSNLTAATTALTEGVTPAGSSLSKTDYEATVAQYGDYVTLTDWLDMTGLDKTAVEATDILADQAGDTHDQLCRNVLVAGTQVCYSAASAAQAQVDDIVKLGNIKYALNLLERGNVKTIKEKINSGANYSTYAVDPGYIYIGHPDQRFDFESLSGFIPVRNYAQPGNALPGEVGAIGLARVVLTSNCKILADTGTTPATGVRSTSGSATDVYQNIVFGQGAYGNSRIGPSAVKSIVKSFGSAGTADPLDQRSTVGWKSTFVTKILDDSRIVRIECGAGATVNFTT